MKKEYNKSNKEQANTTRHSEEKDLMKQSKENDLLKQSEENTPVKQSKENRTPLIYIISQAFYGNRTGTEIRPENLDYFILGYMDTSLAPSINADRTIIHVPGSEKLVFIYNKYAEEERLEDGRKWFKEKGYEIRPLAEIPEMGIKIFSRCIACRMGVDGELRSLEEEDYKLVMRYFAK